MQGTKDDAHATPFIMEGTEDDAALAQALQEHEAADDMYGGVVNTDVIARPRVLVEPDNFTSDPTISPRTRAAIEAASVATPVRDTPATVALAPTPAGATFNPDGIDLTGIPEHEREAYLNSWAIAHSLDQEREEHRAYQLANRAEYDNAISNLVADEIPNSGWSFMDFFTGAGRFFGDDIARREARRRLKDRLTTYNLAEIGIDGDGNCQFAAIADQLYRNPTLHSQVRQMVVKQLMNNRHIYGLFVQGEPFDAYVQRMSQPGEWGDHVTLQAAADLYGVEVKIISSYEANDVILEVKPREAFNERVLWLSFVAEYHYNSVYPKADIEAERAIREANAPQESRCCVQ